MGKNDGTLIEARDNPEASFDGQQLNTPWDDVHVAYFSGEALWTYLNTPFIYARSDFSTEEISSIEVDGETWRRLKITFPGTVKSHTREQISCFGADGLLRRHDYTVDIGTSTASSCRPNDGSMPTKVTTSWSKSRSSSQSISPTSNWPSRSAHVIKVRQVATPPCSDDFRLFID